MIQHGIITQAGWAEVAKGNIKEDLGRDTRQAVVTELYGLLSNRVPQGMFDQLTLDLAKIRKDRDWLHRGDWEMGGRNDHHWMQPSTP